MRNRHAHAMTCARAANPSNSAKEEKGMYTKQQPRSIRTTATTYMAALLVILLTSGTPQADAAKRKPRPDLRVSALSLKTTSVAPGGKLAARVTTRNAGRRRSKPSRTGFYLSTTRKARPAGTALEPSQAVPALRRGRAATANMKLTVPALVAPGGYYLVACSNAAKRVKSNGPRRCRAAAALVNVTAPAGGGGDTPGPGGGDAPGPGGGDAPAPDPAPVDDAGEPDEEHVSPTLILGGVDKSAFNDVHTAATFKIAGGAFSLEPGDTAVTVNGNPVDPSQVQVSADTIVVSESLTDGANDIALSAVDDGGYPLHQSERVWAGTNDLTVKLEQEQGGAFTSPADVKLELADDLSVTASAHVETGSVTFQHVPNSTLLADAVAPGNVRGSEGGTPFDGDMVVRMSGIGTVSSVDNNDFSKGTDGWNVGTAPVQVGDHVEGEPPSDEGGEEFAVAAKEAAPAADQDLTLSTSGEGEQSVSRTFATDEGTTAVQARYRFVTSEVPGGYFGSQYNDYFRVVLRSGSGGQEAEKNSMNALGLGAFDGGGGTGWREVTLPTDEKGDTVRIDLAVANVADGALQSRVVVDSIKQIKVRVIPTLAWNSTKGGLDLSYDVKGAKLEEERNIQVWFAKGSQYGDRLGTAWSTTKVPAGTQPGHYGPIHVAGSAIPAAPKGTKRVLAASNETDFGSMADVDFTRGSNAWPSVPDAMAVSLRESLRVAGQAHATVTSIQRTPADVARIYFDNVTVGKQTVAAVQAAIDYQLSQYGPNGDAVFQTLRNHIAGLTRAEITAKAAELRQHMVDKINQLGCFNVSHHCETPSSLAVIDIADGEFNSHNGDVFYTAIRARTTAAKAKHEVKNHCYHVEKSI
jgi:hypothetical protein